MHIKFTRNNYTVTLYYTEVWNFKMDEGLWRNFLRRYLTSLDHLESLSYNTLNNNDSRPAAIPQIFSL